MRAKLRFWFWTAVFFGALPAILVVFPVRFFLAELWDGAKDACSRARNEFEVLLSAIPYWRTHVKDVIADIDERKARK